MVCVHFLAPEPRAPQAGALCVGRRAGPRAPGGVPCPRVSRRAKAINLPRGRGWNRKSGQEVGANPGNLGLRRARVYTGGLESPPGAGGAVSSGHITCISTVPRPCGQGPPPWRVIKTVHETLSSGEAVLDSANLQALVKGGEGCWADVPETEQQKVLGIQKTTL